METWEVFQQSTSISLQEIFWLGESAKYLNNHEHFDADSWNGRSHTDSVEGLFLLYRPLKSVAWKGGM